MNKLKYKQSINADTKAVNPDYCNYDEISEKYPKWNFVAPKMEVLNQIKVDHEKAVKTHLMLCKYLKKKGEKFGDNYMPKKPFTKRESNIPSNL